MNELTPTQRTILEFIMDFRADNGRSPTGPEVADHFGYGHPSTAYEHLRRIDAKGFLSVDQPSTNAPLQITPTAKARRLLAPGLPVLGSIPAGPVTEVGDDMEVDRVESLGDLLPMMKSGDFLLTVDGDSMADAGIVEGMQVLMRPDADPSDGDICAVWVDGDGGTLKRVYRKGNRVRLVPENEAYDPIEVPAERVRIQAVLVATLSITPAPGR